MGLAPHFSEALAPPFLKVDKVDINKFCSNFDLDIICINNI